jgi:hypothetical protein
MTVCIASGDFNGSTHALTILGAGPTTNITDWPFTLVSWVLADAPANKSAGGIGKASVNTDKIHLEQRVFAGPTDVMLTQTRVNNVTGHTGGRTFSIGTWVYIAARLISDTSRIFYLNGSASTTDTTNLNWDGTNFVDSAIGKSTSNLFPLYWDGKIAFFQIYNTDLTVNQLAELRYNPTAVRNSVIWDIPLNVSNSAVGNYKDHSGNGYNITGGTAPNVSSSGPPIHFFAGGM